MLASAMEPLAGSVMRPVRHAFVDCAKNGRERNKDQEGEGGDTHNLTQGNAEAVRVFSACRVITQRGREVALKGVASLHLKRGMQVAPPLR